MRVRYDPETKAKAIAAVLSGDSIHKVSRDLGVTRTTILRWVRPQDRTLIAQYVPEKEELGRLIYDYLCAALKALAAQAGVFADTDWLKNKAGSADQLAILHGVLADKSVLVLQGLRPTEDESV